MTPDEVKTLLDNIIAEVGTVADIAAGIDPALIPFIAIGKGVAKTIPKLAAGVTGWIEGNLPTEQEKADLAADIQVFNDPNAP